MKQAGKGFPLELAFLLTYEDLLLLFSSGDCHTVIKKLIKSEQAEKTLLLRKAAMPSTVSKIQLLMCGCACVSWWVFSIHAPFSFT